MKNPLVRDQISKRNITDVFFIS